MNGRGPLVVFAAVIVVALIGAMIAANAGPATIISNLLVWVFNALGAIIEGFVDAFAPWRR